MIESEETRGLCIVKSRGGSDKTDCQLELDLCDQSCDLSDSSLRFSHEEVQESVDGMVLTGWTVRGMLPTGVSSVKTSVELTLQGIPLEGGATVSRNITIVSGTRPIPSIVG